MRGDEGRSRRWEGTLATTEERRTFPRNPLGNCWLRPYVRNPEEAMSQQHGRSATGSRACVAGISLDGTRRVAGDPNLKLEAPHGTDSSRLPAEGTEFEPSVLAVGVGR